MEDPMDFDERTRHSFIIKIWSESPSPGSGARIRRGSITHVPDGRRRTIADLEEIRDFISAYLIDMGVQPPPWSRLVRWLRRWKL
jgi:hypothetical protein